MRRVVRALSVATLAAISLHVIAASAGAAAAQEFKGKIARGYAESEEWWAEKVRPSEDAPNVIIFLLDDTGFAQIESFGGTGELYVNGKKVDETEMPRMHISTYSLAETFDIGVDYGTQVDPDYAGSPFPFSGSSIAWSSR